MEQAQLINVSKVLWPASRFLHLEKRGQAHDPHDNFECNLAELRHIPSRQRLSDYSKVLFLHRDFASRPAPAA